MPQPEAIEAARAALASGEPCVLLMNGQALRAPALAQAARVAEASGARLFHDTFVSRLTRGPGLPAPERLPYFGEQALEALEGTAHLILVGTRPPVSFFAYPDKPSSLVPEGCSVHSLVGVEGDSLAALTALADALNAPASASPVRPPRPEAPGAGPLTPATIAASLGVLMPENAIVVDEAATSGFALPGATAGSPTHDWLALTGGAIGQGLPTAVGAAVACPDRKVLCMQADGSAMYTVQALWTMAREKLDVVTVIFSNRKYAILQVEFMRVGAHNPGPKAMSMLDLSNPDIDWVAMANAMGVEAERVDEATAFHAALARAIATPGPRLIEAVI